MGSLPGLLISLLMFSKYFFVRCNEGGFVSHGRRSNEGIHFSSGLPQAPEFTLDRTVTFRTLNVKWDDLANISELI